MQRVQSARPSGEQSSGGSRCRVGPAPLSPAAELRLLEREAPTRCILASPDTTLFERCRWDPVGEPSWGVTASQKQVPQTPAAHWDQQGRGAGSTLRLSPAPSPWGGGAETLPPTPPPLDTHSEGGGRKSLPVPSGKGRGPQRTKKDQKEGPHFKSADPMPRAQRPPGARGARRREPGRQVAPSLAGSASVSQGPGSRAL